jgi:hypothetical protein
LQQQVFLLLHLPLPSLNRRPPILGPNSRSQVIICTMAIGGIITVIIGIKHCSACSLLRRGAGNNRVRGRISGPFLFPAPEQTLVPKMPGFSGKAGNSIQDARSLYYP